MTQEDKFILKSYQNVKCPNMILIDIAGDMTISVHAHIHIHIC